MRVNESKNGLLSPFQWTLKDVKRIDEAGETAPDRDIIAIYLRREKGRVHLRADLLDLRYGSENEDLDLYFLIGFGDGGSTELPDHLSSPDKFPWKLAVKIYEGGKGIVISPEGKKLGEVPVSYNAQLDTVITSIPEDLLRQAGWKGEKLRISALTAKDFEGRVSDQVVASEDDEILPINVAFVFHGNQPIMKTSAIEEKIFNPKDRTGFKRLLDTIEKYQVPVEIHMSGLLQANFSWSARYFLDRIRELHRRGLISLEGGTWGEHLMPYFADSGVNTKSLKIGKKLVKELTGDNPLIAWSPERVIDGKTLKEIRDSGYKATIADYPTLWFNPTGTEKDFKDTKANYKIHELTSLPDFKIFFIDHVFQQETATTEDGGPSMRLREHFVKQALDVNEERDPERILISMNDWEFVAGFPFGQSNVPSLPDNFENNIRWIKAHPWIRVTTPTRALMSGWKAVRHQVDYSKLQPQTYLQEDYHKLRDVLDRWYNGSPEDESYRNWIPLDRGWDYGGFSDQIKTFKKLGDVFTPGTIMGDIWKGIESMPESSLKDLAILSFLTYIYETAWHDWNVDPSTGKRRISGWERDMAGQIRQIGVLIQAGKWLEKVRSGSFKSQEIYLKDLNMDGDKEAVLSNDKVFIAVSPVGGKIVFAAAYDPKTRDAVPLLGTPLNFPTNEGEAQVNPYLKRIGSPYASHRLSSLTDIPKARDDLLEDELYRLEVEGDEIRVKGRSLEKTFKLNGDTLEVSYLIRDDRLKEVLIGASPDILNLISSGSEGLEATTSKGAILVRGSRRGEVKISTDNASLSLSENEIPLTREVKVIPRSKRFKISLTLKP